MVGDHAAKAAVELELLWLLGHVVVRQVRVHGQIDGRGHLHDGSLSAVLPRLLYGHGLGQHARIEVEPDRCHVAVLLPAEDVARPADLEV